MRDVLLDAYGDYASYNTLYGAGQSFWEGRTGIFFTNNSGFGLARNADFRWGAATAPVNSNNPNSRPVNVVSSTWSYAIPATISDDKLEAAWLLLKYLTTEEEGGGYFARAQGRPSPVIDFNRHPDYQFGSRTGTSSSRRCGTRSPRRRTYWFRWMTPAPKFYGSQHPQQALADAEIRIQQALDALAVLGD